MPAAVCRSSARRRTMAGSSGRLKVIFPICVSSRPGSESVIIVIHTNESFFLWRSPTGAPPGQMRRVPAADAPAVSGFSSASLCAVCRHFVCYVLAADLHWTVVEPSSCIGPSGPEAQRCIGVFSRLPHIAPAGRDLGHSPVCRWS